jgi:molecular chaperone GrpE
MEENKMQGEETVPTDTNFDTELVTDPELTNITSLETTIEKLQKEVDEQKDKYLRLVAEFENYKRRSAKEKIEIIQTAGKEIIVSLLDVIDDCDRAENQIKRSEEINESKEGTLLVFNKIRTTLQHKGLTAMESINTDFDVEKHEAISEIDAASELKGKVIDEVMKGYYLNDKIIRFAKVVVGK